MLPVGALESDEDEDEDDEDDEDEDEDDDVEDDDEDKEDEEEPTPEPAPETELPASQATRNAAASNDSPRHLIFVRITTPSPTLYVQGYEPPGLSPKSDVWLRFSAGL